MTASAKVQASAALVALLLLSMLVARASSAAFVGKTANDGNAFTTGELTLTDDAAGALFTVSNMMPGQRVTKCITVTYTGTLDPSVGPVKLYTTGYTDPDGLDAFLDITVHEGAGVTTNGSCDGFVKGTEIRGTTTLAQFETANSNYGNGAGSWTPTASEGSRGYHIEVQLKSSTPETAEGKSLTAFNLTWEVQTTG
jgi:hypothetical protein